MNINYDRLDNNNVRITRGDDKTSVPGKAYIQSNPAIKKVYVRFDRQEFDHEIDTVNDTISKNGGVAISGIANIHTALETDIFFLVSGGGGSADLDIITVVGNSFEHAKGTIQEWTLEDNDTLEITGVDDETPAIGIIKIIQGTGGGFVPELPGDDSNVRWNLEEGGVTIVGYLWDKENFFFQSDNKEGFAFQPLTKSFTSLVTGLSGDIKARLNTIEQVFDEVGKEKILAFYPMRGGSAASHKWNFMDQRDLDEAFRAAFLGGGWVHSSTGAKGDGSGSYGDTKFNLVFKDDVGEICDLPNPRKFCIMYAAGYNTAPGGSDDHTYFGAARSSFNLIIEAYATNHIDATGGLGTPAVSVGSQSLFKGVFTMHRSDHDLCKVYRNKIQLGSDLTDDYTLTGAVRTDLFLNAQNNAGTARYFSPQECRGFLIVDGDITDEEKELLEDALIAFNSDRPII